MGGWGLPYHHFKRSEKFLLFAGRWVMFGKFKTGILLSADLRASPHIYSRRSRLLFAFPLGKGIVSRKAVSSYHSLPPWGRGTASAVDRVLAESGIWRKRISLYRELSFIAKSPYPPFGHLPPVGKAVMREEFFRRPSGIALYIYSRRSRHLHS